MDIRTSAPQLWTLATVRPTARVDGQYENSVSADPVQQVVTKRYHRPVRYLSEVRALGLLGPRGLSPQLLAACPEQRWVRMALVPGGSLGGPLGEDPGSLRLASTLGRLMRQLHSVSVDGVGELGDLKSQPWSHYVLDHLQARVSQLPLTETRCQRLMTHFRDRIALMADLDRPVLLHHDTKPANILLDADDGLHLCDFDQARSGDPFSDLAKLWWRTFAAERSTAWSRFLAAYECPDDDRTGAKILVYLASHCVGTLAYWHAYRPPGYEVHARQASNLLRVITGVRCHASVSRRRPRALVTTGGEAHRG